MKGLALVVGAGGIGTQLAKDLNKSEKDQKAYFEMTHSTVVRVDESAVNKDDLKKIFLSDIFKL